MESEFGFLFDEPVLSRSPVKRQTAEERGSAAKQRLSALGSDSSSDESNWSIAGHDVSTELIASTGLTSDAAVSDGPLAEQRRVAVLRQRLIALEAAFYDDYGVTLDSSSRAGLQCLMRYNPALRLPLLGAESSGQIVATWESNGECLSLRFLDRYHFHYALAALHDGAMRRTWGEGHSLAFFAEAPDAKRLATTD
jgi:hypothetical protein